MRKLTIIALAALFAVANVSMAEAAKKKGKRAKAKPVAAKTVDSNTGSAMLVRDAVSQIFVPFQPRPR